MLMSIMTHGTNINYPLAELHAHLGASIEPAILWQIAHAMGRKLPIADYQEFSKHIMLSPEHHMPLNDYFSTVYHPLLDKLSSGTRAVEEATYHILSGAYRNGIHLVELRSNPMKHNQNAEVDLDHLTMAMLHGMERALLEHKGLSAGLIFCMAREWGIEQNSRIIEKAIKYRKRGVVGIDVAGPATASFKLEDYRDLFTRAKAAGLGITIHSGEVQDAEDIWEALEFGGATRIGHGIRAAYDKPLMEELTKRGTVLEVCPLSNLATEAVENWDEMTFILRTFIEQKVPFCINTDWPEIIEECRLRTQYQLLLDKKILSAEELQACTRTAFAASFIPKPGNLAAYL